VIYIPVGRTLCAGTRTGPVGLMQSQAFTSTDGNL
jgi:hypothetical protein